MEKAKEQKAKAKVKELTSTEKFDDAVEFGKAEVVSIEPLKGSDKVELSNRIKAQKKAQPVVKKQPAEHKEKPALYSRIDSVCDALKASKSIADLIQKSDDAYVKAGGGSSNLREAKTVTRFCIAVLKHFPDIAIPKV